MPRTCSIQELQRLYCELCGAETLFDEPRDIGQGVTCGACKTTFRVKKIWREMGYKPKQRNREQPSR